MKRETRHKFIIDRIEGDLAVITFYEDDRVKFNLPVSLLPTGARGGDHLQITFTEDEESREELKKRIGELLKDE
ncbi:MAG: DUF3006 domain-containing protein [Acidobacteriota bacterium]